MERSNFISFIVIHLGVAVFGKYSQEMMEASQMDTEQLIRKDNFPIETHFITTDDGYILQCHRIPNPGGKPILLQHGLLDSSATFILMGPGRGLGYILHEKGYDVWMSNVRGNRYSRNHTTLNPDEDAFWKFSWHEIGVHDIPAVIDYVLEKTNSEKLYYVGHSQGTTVLFVMCSMRPEYNDKIILAHCLAPVAFMKHIRTPLLPYARSYFKLPATKNKMELFPTSELVKKLCLKQSMEGVCMNSFYMLMGKDPQQFDMTKYPLLMGHLPAGCGKWQVEHYIQEVDSGNFCQMDHGKDNQKIYGQATPPKYELKKVTCPIALHYGLNDFLAEPQDVLRLAEALPNVVEINKVNNPLWNHIDFLYGKDVIPEVYDHIFEKNNAYQ